MSMRLFLILGGFCILAACGSGVSWPPATPAPVHSATAAPSPSPSLAPTPTPTPLPVAVQRSIASQAFASAFISQRAFLYNSGNSYVPASVVRRAVSDLGAPKVMPRNSRVHPLQATPKSGYGPCTNGLESASGPATEYYQVFYDNACTTLYQVVTYNTSSDPPDDDIAGCITSYATGGAVDGYETMTLAQDTTDTPNTSTLEANTAVSESAAMTTTIGLSCSGSGTLTCGDGFTDSLTSGSDIGDLASLPITVTNGTGSTIAIHNGTSVSYTGALDALVLNTPAPASFTTWTISNGTAGAGAAINANLSFSTNGIAQSGSTLTATDSTDGGVLTLTTSATGFTGNIVQHGAALTLTTFALDLTGTGTITYSNLTACPVVLWMPSC